MSFTYNRLRGKIVEVFGSQSKFAAELSNYKGKNIAVQVISAKLTGKIKFTIDDVYDWCMVLKIPVSDIGYYFFDCILSKDETENKSYE